MVVVARCHVGIVMTHPRAGALDLRVGGIDLAQHRRRLGRQHVVRVEHGDDIGLGLADQTPLSADATQVRIIAQEAHLIADPQVPHSVADPLQRAIRAGVVADEATPPVVGLRGERGQAVLHIGCLVVVRNQISQLFHHAIQSGGALPLHHQPVAKVAA